MATNESNRRVNRSNDIQLALSFQLAEAARLAKFSSIALADDLGTVIAAAGNKEICEHMAAFSPILTASRAESWCGSITTDAGEVYASITPVMVGGSRLYLAAAGGKRAAAHTVLSESGYGVSRILS